MDLPASQINVLRIRYSKIYLFPDQCDIVIRVRRTIKATLLLVPLLGVSNIPLFYEPDEPSGAYMLGSAILQHSQVTPSLPPPSLSLR